MKTRPHNAAPALAHIPTIFDEGRNCHRVARAGRASVLIDAENYFNAFTQAAELATRSIIILAWDFNSQTQLSGGEAHEAPTLGALLNDLVKRRPGLHIHVLDWDYPTIYGSDREIAPIYGLDWTPARRVHFRYDNAPAAGGSHHQNIVVIDDAVAFSGGLDLTTRHWDTSAHSANEPRRTWDEAPYPPFHDVMAMVDGDAARVLGDIARERWKRATG